MEALSLNKGGNNIQQGYDQKIFYLSKILTVPESSFIFLLV
jgi:hypothetical protein